LKVADADLAAQLRGVLASGDDYAGAGKPQIDWDDPAAREGLVDSRARDAFAGLAVLDGRELAEQVEQAAKLLATVVGQDLTEGADGVFRIARKVAKDRIISTVDPDARHGHKTSARGFDGYKGHAALDPDSEIITATTVTPGNAGDASAAEDLLADLLNHHPAAEHTDDTGDAGDTGDTPGAEQSDPAGRPESEPDRQQRPAAYGDAAYGTGQLQARLEDAGIDSGCRTQPPTARHGQFTKDRFDIDLPNDTVTCPAGRTVAIRWGTDGSGTASFAEHCAGCPLREQCTTSATGRTIQIGPHEQVLTRARARQADPAWQADCRATRPKVERKLAHLMRRKHGGRRARVRGTVKVDTDFRLLAAATNLARLAVLGLHSTATSWTVATP
jgi:IS5 family transposase